jgi:multidrug efflux system outer membrane protein
MKLKNYSLPLIFVFFAGCTLAPKSKEMKLPVPEEFVTTKLSDEKNKNSLAKLSWEEFYKLDDFKVLISKALKSNRAYNITKLNIKEFEALYSIQRSDLLPNIQASGGYNRQKISPNALGNGGLFGGGGSQQGFIQSQKRASIGLTSYEIDFFGRIRSLKNAALQDYFASEFAQKSQKINLIAELSAAYMRYLSDLELQRLTDQTFKLQENVLKIIKQRLKAKVVSEIELRQAETLYESLRADSIEQSRRVLLGWNSIKVLVGENIQRKDFKTSFLQVLSSIRVFPVNTDSTILLSRPDIKKAETDLIAANARIGAARAAFFPSISLTSSAGYLSSEASNLFEADSQTWAFSPNINLPIFTGGRNTARLKVANIRKKKSILAYELAIQKAFQEVSDGLVSHEKIESQINAQFKVANTASRATELSELRYKSGVDSYLVTLDARRSQYEAQRKLIEIQRQFFSNYVYLYKALGGGVYKNLIAIRAKLIASIPKAGSDFFIGSLTLMCMVSAPNIKKATTRAAGKLNTG